MIRWTGLAPWEFQFPFPGSLTSTFLQDQEEAETAKRAAQRRRALEVPYTLNPNPPALHPTPYTLHSTPYTLHPKPYAQILQEEEEVARRAAALRRRCGVLGSGFRVSLSVSPSLPLPPPCSLLLGEDPLRCPLSGQCARGGGRGRQARLCSPPEVFFFFNTLKPRVE